MPAESIRYRQSAYRLTKSSFGRTGAGNARRGGGRPRSPRTRSGPQRELSHDAKNRNTRAGCPPAKHALPPLTRRIRCPEDVEPTTPEPRRADDANVQDLTNGYAMAGTQYSTRASVPSPPRVAPRVSVQVLGPDAHGCNQTGRSPHEPLCRSKRGQPQFSAAGPIERDIVGKLATTRDKVPPTCNRQVVGSSPTAGSERPGQSVDFCDPSRTDDLVPTAVPPTPGETTWREVATADSAGNDPRPAIWRRSVQVRPDSPELVEESPRPLRTPGSGAPTVSATSSGGRQAWSPP
jgi:hypothetical protein